MKKLLTFLMLLMPLVGFSQNGKKVYVDFHGVRFTRQHDGKLGRWGLYANTEKSATGIRSLCYNADILHEETGRNNIAAAAYPSLGMQSDLDPDYIEYQILLAKTAGVDGFFIEWGFFPHENNTLLQAMLPAARKYNFEIGVNWCDGWLYYDWITKIYPQINNREAKTAYMAKCFQYLIDSVFTAPTAPIVCGRPVFYHFGPGARVDEFREVLSAVNFGEAAPVGLRRWADWGELRNDVYMPVRYSEEIKQWEQLGEVPTAWIPARVRPRDARHPQCDHYATEADLIEFMKPFRDSVWLSPNPQYVVKSGFAMPGMDNRGCAGWGRSHFYFIPRNNGQTYRDMWNFCMESADSLDMMFIASWNDFTEGHEILPTIENGNRELQTTLEYASMFKDMEADYHGLALPEKLFSLRKTAYFLTMLKADVQSQQAVLDQAALNISAGKYREAEAQLHQLQEQFNERMKGIKQETLTLSEFDVDIKHKQNDAEAGVEEFSITLPVKATVLFQQHYFKAYLEFDYLDRGQEFVHIGCKTNRVPKESYNTVAHFRTDDSKTWKHAKIELFKENLSFPYNKPFLFFKGRSKFRNISMVFSLYK